MTREEIKEKTSLFFFLNPNNSEEEKKCVIEKVMATRATIVSKPVLCNIITYLQKKNTELKEKVGKYQIGMFDEIEKRDKRLTKAEELIKRFSAFVNNEIEYDPEHPQEHTDSWNKLCEQAKQFLKEIEK